MLVKGIRKISRVVEPHLFRNFFYGQICVVNKVKCLRKPCFQQKLTEAGVVIFSKYAVEICGVHMKQLRRFFKGKGGVVIFTYISVYL